MKKKLVVLVTAVLLVFLLAIPAFAEGGDEGWLTAMLKYRYNDDDVTWVDTGHGWSCVYNRDGKPITDKWVVIHKAGVRQQTAKTYYFGEDGIMHTGWLYYENNWYYFRPDGSAIMDEAPYEIDGATYMFNIRGEMYRDKTISRGDKTYTFDADGHLIDSGADKTDYNNNRNSTMDQVEYLNLYRTEKGISPLTHDKDFDQVARDAFAYAEANGGTISLSKVYSLAVSSSHNVSHIAYIYATASEKGSFVYLTDAAEELLRNLWYTRVGYYKEGSDIMIIIAAYDGEAATQLSPEVAQGTWLMDQGHWKYKRTDGSYAASCWLSNPKDGKWYHFDENGYMQKGWFEDEDGKWYYLSPDTGEMLANTAIDGYTLGADGVWVR